MPGINRFSLDTLPQELEEVVNLGITSVLLFGIPKHKDATGSETWNDEGIIQQAIRTIKKLHPNLYVMTDVCFCEYTSHGHCGVLKGHEVDNDATLVNIAKQVVSHAKAGADMFITGSALFGTDDYAATINTMRRALNS